MTEGGSDSTPPASDGGVAQWEGVATFRPAFDSAGKSELNLVLGDYAGVCALATAGKDKANSRGVQTSAGKPNGANLTITSITAAKVKGTFMVTFDGAPCIGGPFVAVSCPERPKDAGAKTCAP